jgi:hypothetical protein
MSQNWYSKSLIKIADVLKNIKEIASSVSKIKGVKSVYIWGSFLENKNNPLSTIKDLDLVAKTGLYSEDLLSINDDNNHSALKMASSKLEGEGFDPKSVLFTKSFIDITKFGVDHWAISSDKKILHWGSVISDEEERKEIQKEAEDFASFEIGMDKKAIKKANSKIQDRWSVLYDHHVNKYLKDMPKGWYEIECDYSKTFKKMERL